MEQLMNNGFCEMSQEEAYEVDGGFWAEVALGAKYVCGTVGAAVGLGPVGGGVLIGACVVAVGVAIYAGNQD